MKRFFAFLSRLFDKFVELPDTLAKWAKHIPIDRVLLYVAEAEAIAGLDGAGKRDYAAKRLSAWARSKGYSVPPSVINWLIETALAVYNEKHGRGTPD